MSLCLIGVPLHTVTISGASAWFICTDLEKHAREHGGPFKVGSQLVDAPLILKLILRVDFKEREDRSFF